MFVQLCCGVCVAGRDVMKIRHQLDQAAHPRLSSYTRHSIEPRRATLRPITQGPGCVNRVGSWGVGMFVYISLGQAGRRKSTTPFGPTCAQPTAERFGSLKPWTKLLRSSELAMTSWCTACGGVIGQALSVARARCPAIITSAMSPVSRV